MKKQIFFISLMIFSLDSFAFGDDKSLSFAAGFTSSGHSRYNVSYGGTAHVDYVIKNKFAFGFNYAYAHDLYTIQYSQFQALGRWYFADYKYFKAFLHVQSGLFTHTESLKTLHREANETVLGFTGGAAAGIRIMFPANIFLDLSGGGGWPQKWMASAMLGYMFQGGGASSPAFSNNKKNVQREQEQREQFEKEKAITIAALNSQSAADTKKLSEEKEAAERARRAAEDRARLAEAKAAADTKRLSDEKLAAENARRAAEERAAAAERRLVEAQAAAAAAAAAAKKLSDSNNDSETKKLAEDLANAVLAEETKTAEDARRAAQIKAAEDAKKAAQEKAAQEKAAQEKAMADKALADAIARENAKAAAGGNKPAVILKPADNNTTNNTTKPAVNLKPDTKIESEYPTAPVSPVTGKRLIGVTAPINAASGGSYVAKTPVSIAAPDIKRGEFYKLPNTAIYFSGTNLFGSDTSSSDLDSSVVAKNNLILESLSQFLIENPNYKLIVEGHANSSQVTAAAKQNEEDRYLKPITLDRARAVIRRLEQLGAPRASMEARGLGGTRPIADMNDTENLWKNRRTEFIITLK